MVLCAFTQISIAYIMSKVKSLNHITVKYQLKRSIILPRDGHIAGRREELSQPFLVFRL